MVPVPAQIGKKTPSNNLNTVYYGPAMPAYFIWICKFVKHPQSITVYAQGASRMFSPVPGDGVLTKEINQYSFVLRQITGSTSGHTNNVSVTSPRHMNTAYCHHAFRT